MLNTIFSAVLDLQLTACYVIGLVLILRLCLRRQPKIYSYTLWTVVLFRLLCPFRFKTVLSLIPRKVQTVPQIVITERASVTPATTTTAFTTPSAFDLPTVPMATIEPNSFDLTSLLSYIWLVGAVILLLYSLYGLSKLQLRLRYAKHLEDNIYQAQGLETAFVLGIVKPRIYLPTGLSAEEQEYILLHERTHLRRGDHLIKIAAFIALCIHWFNPLVWLSFALSAQDMEMSCDEAVIGKLGNEVKKAYSGSLLSLAAGKHLLKATPLAFGEGDTRVRIKNILNYRKPGFWLSVVLVALVAAVGIGLASDPMSKESDVSVEEAEELMAYYFPAPYIIEADGQENVVGDEQDDWQYNVYLNINKAISATETAQEIRKIDTIAIDGVKRDIWKQKESIWSLHHDYIEVDYETLWNNRTDYIGDNSKVSHIAGNLPYPDYITYEGISIQSSKEPYELTVRLSTDSKEALDSIDLKLVNTWDKILYSLIGNLGGRRYEISGPHGSKSWGMGYYDNSEDFAAAETLDGFITAVENEVQRYWRASAESMLDLANRTENMKRAAIYYMEWPEDVSVKSLKYGAEWLTYGLYCDIGFSGMTAPQIGSVEEQLFRSNAAAMLEGFSCSTVNYQFDNGESLVYSNMERVGMLISEAEIAAKAEQAAFLRSIAEGNIPQEESTAEVLEFIFPLFEENLQGISAQYEEEKHDGVDFIAAEGADILAVEDGIVTTAEYDTEQGRGFYVRVKHDGGYESLCAHCKELLVSVGQQVKAGDVIASVGSSGLSTGPHLHFVLSKDDETVDPMFYLGQTDEPFLFPLPKDSGYTLIRPYSEENNLDAEKSGIDFAVAEGTDILAVRDGTVKWIQTWRSKGKQIVIYHGQGWYATYNHCGTILVEEGQKVKAGEIIAKVAASDGESQAIFNFELGQSWNKAVVDPMKYLE